MSGSGPQGIGAAPSEQQQQQPPESSLPPEGESFNPLTNATHDTTTNSAIGNSVVKDLMRVYESLTQSSTPQQQQTPTESSSSQGGGGGNTNMPQESSHLQSQQQQQQQYDHDHSIMQGYPPPNPQYSQHLPHQQQQAQIPPQYSQQHTMSYPYPPPPNHYYPEPHHQYHQQQQQGAPIPYSMAPPDQPPSYGMPPSQQDPQQPQMPSSSSSEPNTTSQMDLKDDDSSDENISEDPQEPRTSRSKRKKRGGPEVDASVTSSKGSVVSKKKKKGKTADGRWCKRFTWPEDLHRDFVSAIFDVGLKHSSPSTILEHMPKNDQITTERIKSHLQKYRMHRAKSKKEFATSYDHALSKLQANGLNGVKSLSAGEVPAHLAYTALQEQQQGNGNNNNISSPVTSSPMLDKSAMNNNHNQSPKQAPGRQPGGDALMLPQLTEAEKASPIGASMGYLMGLFFSLKQQLMVQRSMEARAENDKNNAPDVQAVFNSFVGSIPPSAPALAGGGPDNNMILHHDNNTNNLQNQVSFDQNSSVAASKTPSVLAAPSVRTNLEENNMMKREMQNQMAFQNKMRALKQQELNKYKNVSSGEQLKEEGNNKEKVEDMNHVHYASSSSIPMKQQQQQDEEDSKAAEAAERYQGAGEAGGADPSSDPHVRSRSRGMSMGGSDEFWNTDVVDEQLFEFLMNN